MKFKDKKSKNIFIFIIFLLAYILFMLIPNFNYSFILFRPEAILVALTLIFGWPAILGVVFGSFIDVSVYVGKIDFMMILPLTLFVSMYLAHKFILKFKSNYFVATWIVTLIMTLIMGSYSYFNPPLSETYFGISSWFGVFMQSFISINVIGYLLIKYLTGKKIDKKIEKRIGIGILFAIFYTLFYELPTLEVFGYLVPIRLEAALIPLSLLFGGFGVFLISLSAFVANIHYALISGYTSLYFFSIINSIIFLLGASAGYLFLKKRKNYFLAALLITIIITPLFVLYWILLGADTNFSITLLVESLVSINVVGYSILLFLKSNKNLGRLIKSIK